MYKQCQTKSSASRQREMEEGLLRIMLRKQYEEISVSDLCKELGVPRKSFYRYFDGKDGALYALIDHALMDYDAYTVFPELERTNSPLEYVQRIFSYWYQKRELLDALEKSGLSGVLIQRALEFSKDMDTMPRFMQITDNRLRGYGTLFTVCGVMAMITQWHHDGFSSSTEEMAQLALQLFANPLFSEA